MLGNDFHVIIPAAGIGERFAAKCPKQYINIHGKTVLEHSLSVFLPNSHIKSIMLVIAPNDDYFSKLNLHHSKLNIVLGGQTRFESVHKGLQQLKNVADHDWILVHDAARCCLNPQDLDNLISTLYEEEVGGILAEPMTDTLKLHQNGVITKTLPRDNAACAQTPQMFRFQLLKQAFMQCFNNEVVPTDEAQAIEMLGLQPKLVFGNNANPKLTTAKDIYLFETLLSASEAISIS